MGTLHIYFFILSNLKDIIYFYIVFEIVEAPTYIFLVLCKKKEYLLFTELAKLKKRKGFTTMRNSHATTLILPS